LPKPVHSAELILCPAPAFAQRDIAKLLAPHLAEGQVVFLPPATFGSMIFASAARDIGNGAAASFAETGTLPWLTRKHGPFRSRHHHPRQHGCRSAVFPLKAKDHALDVIGRAFPGVIEPCGDALSAALMNAGPIIHPPLIVMNAGPIEHFERLGHPQGGPRKARSAGLPMRSITERIAVRKGFGYGGPHFPLAHHYASEGEQGCMARLARSPDRFRRLA